MILDFTSEVKLSKRHYDTYVRLKIALYILAFILALYAAYAIIFPTQYFSFSFLNPNSTQNTIIRPRDSQGEFLEHGNISPGHTNYFDAALVGNYSRAKVSLVLGTKSEKPEDISVEARKSYQAFLYPEGSPIGLKDGTLVRTDEEYFMVSDGKIRRFSNEKLVSALGYAFDAFLKADGNDLKYNEKGYDITDAQTYPDSSLFKVDGNYYILKDQKLEKFVSASAFQSQYDENQAIEKDISLFQQYGQSDIPAGFSDGSLVSYGISAFLVSSGRILPINNTVTFSAMGYDWSDVIPASGDEIALYEKDRLFTISSAHPDGTIFVTKEDDKWYMIKDKQKHLLPSAIIAKSWLKTTPITVSRSGLAAIGSCRAEKEALSFRTYSCTIPIDSAQNILGKDYEFIVKSGNNIKIDNINVSFEKTASTDNFKLAAKDLINKVKGNYVAQNPSSGQ